MVRPTLAMKKKRENMAKARMALNKKVDSESSIRDTRSLLEEVPEPIIEKKSVNDVEELVQQSTSEFSSQGGAYSKNKEMRIVYLKLANSARESKRILAETRTKALSDKMKNINLVRAKDREIIKLQSKDNVNKPPQRTMTKYFEELSQSGQKKRLSIQKRQVQEALGNNYAIVKVTNDKIIHPEVGVR